MICIAKRGTEFEKSLIEHGAQLLDDSDPVFVTYSEQTTERIYEEKVEKSVSVSRKN